MLLIGIENYKQPLLLRGIIVRCYLTYRREQPMSRISITILTRDLIVEPQEC